jgi:hypothetical protein
MLAVPVKVLDGHLWECHSPSRFRLVGRDVWLMRDAGGWHVAKAGDARRVDVESREEGTEYVALAFATFGQH